MSLKTILASAATALALYTSTQAGTISVNIENTRFIGVYNETLGVDMFRGISYGTAERFRRVVPPVYNGTTVNATFYGVACPQIKGTNALAVDYGIYGTDEDCTILDIYRPHGINPGIKLPVMLWLHGGALTQGAASHYPGYGIVAESAKIGLPVIQISINYRLALWGFLGGQEAATNGALNLGLYDQRAALEWVQQYIEFFGGDKKKVTVFGQSSGAMSIAYHYLTQNTTLFRAGILESGSSTSVPVLPPTQYQPVYNNLVNVTGCSNTTNTFECLRTVNESVLAEAVNTVFANSDANSGRPWGVAIDGDIIPESPSVLTAQGKIAHLPFLIGDVRDEGTIFVKPQALNTTSDFINFLNRDYITRNASFIFNETTIAIIEALYPDVPALGSPFGSGNETFWGKEFKRGAAVYGDLHFHAPRRNWLDVADRIGIPSWCYEFAEFTAGTAAWQGVFHTAEIPYVFMQFDPSDGAEYNLAKMMLAYWVSFATHLDPSFSGRQHASSGSSANPHPHPHPRWTPYGRHRQTLYVTANETKMIEDSFRRVQTDFLTSVSDQFLEPMVIV